MNNDPASLPDLVARAAAILAQQVPALVAAAPGLKPPAAPALLPTAPAILPVSQVSVEELRQRALDLVSALFSTVNSPPPQPLAPVSAALPWLRAMAPVAAGQSLAIPVAIENDQPQPADVCLYSTDLLNDEGRSIPGHQVSFEPPSLTLAPGQRATVQAHVAVPLQSIPGAYTGLVQTQGLSTAKSVITIDVA
jgi:hypothetical protein